MNRADRRAEARASRGHGLNCECEHLGLFVVTAKCSSCGAEQSREWWVPTSGQVGDSRECGFNCTEPGCDAEVEGRGLIMSTRPL